MSTLPLSPAGALMAYGGPLDGEIADLAERLADLPGIAGIYPPRWLAIQLLEGEESLLDEAAPAERAAAAQSLAASRDRLLAAYGDELDLVIADARYRVIRQVVAQSLARPESPEITLSERIDRIVTHKYLGIPIFMALMLLVFGLVQNVSAPYVDWMDTVISGPVTRWAGALLAAAHAPGWVLSLALDGAITGVGGVLAFVPGLLALYFILAALEESGYLARAAFVMDRAISALGLHGKSFIPMILGFGCNVPAVYATRTIESRPARILTGLLIPFMSCSARLPVYVIFGMAFFPQRADMVIWAMYLSGIVVAATVGVALSQTVFRGAQRGAFVMELSPYRLPTLRGLWRQAWRHTAGFVRKAGTVILAASLGLWLLLHLPWGVENPRDSAFGQLSGAAAVALAPAGFGTWQAAGSLLTGVMAKEVVVSTMAQVYVGEAPAAPAAPASLADDADLIFGGLLRATGAAGGALLDALTPGVTLFPAAAEPPDTALGAALQRAFTPLSALAFMIFVLLYVPCVSTVGAQIQEFGPRWALASLGLTLAVPWLAAVAIYQVGRLLGVG
ncbi:ferrous iron transport protein B [Oscillochloris sp. ZM17-4]|uniref:ferrous iron transport protein B n=1 Tax=Oscillochloris sp. ZM17-4 TaxID=2866714 RepID=UPI001C737DA5|nr:ferrous iron transport protein B [Oscillochloris sp. ZM17-4]MBX0328467.1 ferrous iron transport protein B [Oscillochloris sp. ZM17-4]